MQERNQINSLNADQGKPEPNPEDLSKLLNYPSIGELFSERDTRRLEDFCARLTLTRDNLERVVRYGNRSEAESAQRAARGIEVTLEFLQTLQKMRVSDGK